MELQFLSITYFGTDYTKHAARQTKYGPNLATFAQLGSLGAGKRADTERRDESRPSGAQ